MPFKVGRSRPKAWASTSRGPSPIAPCWRRSARAPERTLFVAGSASDVPGAKGVGMPVYWHNRVGLPPRDDARPDYLEPTPRPAGRPVSSGLEGGLWCRRNGRKRVAEAGQFKPEEHRFGPTHWFEDLKVGQKFYINSRTQTEVDVRRLPARQRRQPSDPLRPRILQGARPSRPAGARPAGGDPGRGGRRHLSRMSSAIR